VHTIRAPIPKYLVLTESIGVHVLSVRGRLWLLLEAVVDVVRPYIATPLYGCIDTVQA
jgi:hypothetical protein